MNIVPWSSAEEWLHVYHCLRDNQLDEALVLISGWKRRMGSDTPTGVLATHAVLVGLESIREKGESPETIFCASGALTQAIGLMVERLRVDKDDPRNVKPMHITAREIGIPDWVINLRHRLAHGPGEQNMTGLNEALKIVLKALIYNENNYWHHQYVLYKEDIEFSNRSLSKREISALKTAVLNIHNKDTLDEVKDICAEQIYRDYFCRLLLDQMLNHNLDTECVRAIRDLELIPQITDSLSRLYKLNYEADMEIISTSDILKWMEVLIKMDRLSEGNLCGILGNIGIVPRPETRMILSMMKSCIQKWPDSTLIDTKINQVYKLLNLYDGKLKPEVNENDQAQNECEPEVNEKVIWRMSNENWNHVPAGLRPGYTCSDLSRDIIKMKS